jgi:branched-chain amino acid aminotransferase
VFEGLRAYDTPAGPAVFRLGAHVRRLAASCKVLRMPLAWSEAELCAAVLATLRANRLGRAYIRPLVVRGFGAMGVMPLANPVRVVIAAWPTRGRYLGPESAEEGIDVRVSSWRRSPPDVQPPTTKATANYLASQLVTLEALDSGCREGIALDRHGNLAEGSAENLFVVEDGALWTPPLASSILAGITRDSILTLAREAGLPVHEQPLPRAMLYTCDELFMTGTSAEVVPVRSVDGIPVGAGRPGPLTRRLATRFMALAGGEAEDVFGWRTAVYGDGTARDGAAAPERAETLRR